MRQGHLLQGTVDMLVMRTLDAGSLHGYDIAHTLHRTSKRRLRILDGALYGALARLEARGWIESQRGQSRTGKVARFYALTAAGRRQYRLEVSKWYRYITAVSWVLK